jgi:hypothetical protein
MKNFRIVVIAFLALLSFSVPVLSQTPRLFQVDYQVAKNPEPSLYCYEKTADGQIIDLSKLCGKPQENNCDPAYPDVCIPPTSVREVNCPELKAQGIRNIRVLSPDPQGLDGNDNDGIGCEE